MLRVAVLSVTLSILASSVAWSQEPSTREEADRQRREQQAKEVKPYEPNRVERALDFAEDKAIFILDREGFHPKLGSLTTGSGFAYGLGFRDRDLFSNTGALEIWAAGSVKRYWATEGRLTFPRLADNHLLPRDLGQSPRLSARKFLWPRTRFKPDDRSDYAIRTNHFGGRVAVRPTARHLLVGGGTSDLQPRLGTGQNDRFPNTADEFNPSEAPGIDARADFLRTEAFLEVDYREPRYPKKGGWYRVDFSHYDDRTLGQFSFNRIDADLRQFIGFLAGRRVIAARLFVSTSDTSAGQTMPFYFMPTLGGNETLRGFREYRFRAPHAILAQGEYRWEIWSGFDAALFSTTPERSRTVVTISISRTSNRTTALGSGSTATAASSFVSMPRLEVVMASTSISSSAAFSRMASGRRASPAQWVALAGLVGLLAAGTFVSLRSAAPHFYPDDPRWTDDDRAMDASKAGPIKTRTATTSVVNTLGHPGERRDVRALNVNTVDEVPDSSWFTNRIGRKALSVAEIARGPDRSERVTLDGWKVSAGKSTGVQPGFRMTDAEGQLYQVEVDPPSNPELASGAEMIGTAFYHAIGYNVVDVYLAELDRESLVIADTATIRDPLNGRRRRLKKYDLDNVFNRAARLENGRYPVLVSRFAPGKPLGNFRYYSRRPDDPNDLVLHEHRRELRGARVFGAWLNHDDSRGINSLDMLETTSGRAWIKHYMFDFGSILGSGTVYAQRHRPGNEYMFRAETRVADAGHAWSVRETVDDHQLSSRAPLGRTARGRALQSTHVETGIPQPGLRKHAAG